MMEKMHSEIMMILCFIAAGIWLPINKYVAVGMLIGALCYVIIDVLDMIIQKLQKKV